MVVVLGNVAAGILQIWSLFRNNFWVSSWYFLQISCNIYFALQCEVVNHTAHLWWKGSRQILRKIIYSELYYGHGEGRIMDKWLTEGSLGLGHFRSLTIPSPTPRGPWTHIPFVCLSFLLRMAERGDTFKMLWYPNGSYRLLFTDLQHSGFYYLDLYIAWCW